MKILLGKKDIEEIIQNIVKKTIYNESEQVKQLNDKVNSILLKHDEKIDRMIGEYEEIEQDYFNAQEKVSELTEQLETHKALVESITKEKDFHIEQENKWKEAYESEISKYEELKNKFDSVYRKYCLLLDKDELLSKKNDTYKDFISDIKSLIEDMEIEIEDVDNEEE